VGADHLSRTSPPTIVRVAIISSNYSSYFTFLGAARYSPIRDLPSSVLEVVDPLSHQEAQTVAKFVPFFTGQHRRMGI